MRKGIYFWFTIILAAAVIAGGYMYFGHRPVTLTVSEVLPAVEEGLPYVLVVAPGDQIGAEIPEEVVRKASLRSKSYYRLMRGLLPLAGLSKETALLAVGARDTGKAELYGAFLFTIKETSALSSGRVPETWKEALPEVSAERTGKNRYRMSLGADAPELYFITRGDMLLLSLEEAGIDRMIETIDDPASRMNVSWTLETAWPGHFLFNDGGVLAEKASFDGLDVGYAPIRLEAAWEKTGGKGILAWSIGGIEGWIPPEIKEALQGHFWREELYMPEPLIAAAGFNLPRVVPGGSKLWDELSEAAETLGVGTDLLARVLEGPAMIVVGGRSRLLLVNLPGFLLELPDRGKEGIELVKTLWERDFMRVPMEPRPLEGFEAGGSLSIPLTVVGAASEELVVMGAMDVSEIGELLPLKSIFDLPETAPAWVYVDFPKAAQALRNLSTAGGLAQKIGISGGEGLEELAESAEKLAELGKILVVIQDYKTGRISWEQ